MGVKIGLGLLLVVAPGCFWATTKHEGQVMREQIGNIDTRLKSQEQVLEGRVKQLDESIDKATKMLARNSADLGTQVDRFSEEMATFAGRLELLQRTMDAARNELAAVKQAQAEQATRIDAIEKSLGIKPGAPGDPVAAPPDRNTLYDGAVAALQSGKYGEARQKFRLYVQAFAQDEKAPQAGYFIGESFAKEKDFDKAIVEFQRVIDSYPKSDVADDAFLAAGQAALDNKLCVEASAYWGELIRRYGSSPLARTAKSKLDYVKKNSRNKKVCRT
jgi:tol-pal system protein YbgF